MLQCKGIELVSEGRRTPGDPKLSDQTRKKTWGERESVVVVDVNSCRIFRMGGFFELSLGIKGNFEVMTQYV